MNTDAALFFNENPQALALYEAFEGLLLESFPDTVIKAQKTQISFYNRHGFGAAWPAKGRIKNAPRGSLGLTLGLPARAAHPTLALVSEPYPGRFTHHFLISDVSDLDGDFMALVKAAYDFSESKR